MGRGKWMVQEQYINENAKKSEAKWIKTSNAHEMVSYLKA
jgi:hypothetical protein